MKPLYIALLFLSACSSWQSRYDKVEPDPKTGLQIVQKGGKYGIVDADGKELVALQYDAIEIKSPQLILLSQAQKTGFMNGALQVYAAPLYDDYDLQSYPDYGRIWVKKADKWGFIDTTGKEILPIEYDQVHPVFTDSLAVVTRGGKSGYVNIQGQIVLPLLYSSATYFRDGVARVTLDSTWMEIDKKGTCLKNCL